MKFGKTYDQHEEAFRQKRAKMMRRHKWFAWYPVRLANGKHVWLEVVSRQAYSYHRHHAATWTYEVLRDDQTT
jgi:hypothetical protein